MWCAISLFQCAKKNQQLSDFDTYLYRQQDKQDYNSHLELVLTDSLSQPSNRRLKNIQAMSRLPKIPRFYYNQCVRIKFA